MKVTVVKYLVTYPSVSIATVYSTFIWQPDAKGDFIKTAAGGR